MLVAMRRNGSSSKGFFATLLIQTSRCFLGNMFWGRTAFKELDQCRSHIPI
jgi:hypothetical protein